MVVVQRGKVKFFQTNNTIPYLLCTKEVGFPVGNMGT
jgi:hypothetical protein